MTPEILELLQKLAILSTPSAVIANVKQNLELARESLLKSLAVINQVLASLDDEAQLPTIPPTTDPPPIEPEPEPVKKSKWDKFKGVLSKIKGVVGIASLFVPGLAGVAAAVNSFAGAGTVDPIGVGTASLAIPIAAGIAKYYAPPNATK